MYNLTKLYSVVNHLKFISPGMFQDKGSHIAMFCQFCDDATRKPNPQHGHLYVSKNLPVFYCQRCAETGTILKLLLSTGFDDQEAISYLSGFLKYYFTKDYFKINQRRKSKKKKINEIKNFTLNKLWNLRKENRDNYEMFINYIKNRIGNVDFTKFFIYPDYIEFKKNELAFKYFSCCFLNRFGNFSTARVIEKNSYYRFRNSNDNSLYFFQKNDFEKYNQIVLSEGVFDILNTYLYNSKFDMENTFYASVNGKKFISNIEYLTITELLLGDYEINIVFDNDDENFKKTIKIARKIVNSFNNNITIKGWLPSFNLNQRVKDTGDFPSITEIS